MKDKGEMENMVRQFFQELYTADSEVNPWEVLSLFEPVISDDMNLDLCKPFTDEKISDALFQIRPLKAPGPDGLLARFFQRNWALMKEDVVLAVKQFFQSGSMPEGVNETAIVLLPKKDEPEVMLDLRPISLCNVIYKVVLSVWLTG
jgi:hypothetical protein